MASTVRLYRRIADALIQSKFVSLYSQDATKYFAQKDTEVHGGVQKGSVNETGLSCYSCARFDALKGYCYNNSHALLYERLSDNVTLNKATWRG